MTQAGTKPTSPVRERIPLSAVIMAALLATIAFGGGIVFAWSKGWPIIGIASQIIAIPVGAVPMYHVMTRTSPPQHPQAMRWLTGFAMGTMVVEIVIVRLNLISAGLGFAGGIMLGLFWWMVRQRSAAVGQ